MPPLPPPPAPRPDWAYFLDIDGTLVDFTAAPGMARVDEQLLAVMTTLSTFAGGALAIITGRPIAQVDALLPAIGVAAAGLHGLERRSPAGRVSPPRGSPDRLLASRDRLATIIGLHPGLVLEDKRFSLALHYRQSPRLAGYVHRIAKRELRALGPAFGLRRGKRVVEIAPVGGNKGDAIRAFMAEPPFRERRPVFVGDDITDEAGFHAVNGLHGHSIKVGPGPTSARWRLADVGAVRSWMASTSPTPADPA